MLLTTHIYIISVTDNTHTHIYIYDIFSVTQISIRPMMIPGTMLVTVMLFVNEEDRGWREIGWGEDNCS